MSLSLENLSVSESDINQIIYFMLEEELINFMRQIDNNGQSVDYLLELKSRIEQIPIERVSMFVRVLIEEAYDLTGKKGSFITAVSATYYAEHLAEKLLLKFP